jgi:multicomponent Na+:H+ antiporter subunit D
VTYRLQGTFELKKLGGLYRSSPLLSVLFLLPALSLAGIPPLSGFFAKLALIQAGLESGQFVIVGVALGVSVLTLYSMLKIWAEAFWKPQPVAAEGPPARRDLWKERGLVLPIALLAGLTLVLGLAAEPFFALALEAAGQLLDPAVYIQAVLGG